ncbi:MAG: hypothetical protein M1335_06715, partial [Chloroflexi bacterium]|nr:hypothetical protein [Chloroflexota bacterium]
FEVTKGPKGDSASNVKVLQRTQQDDKRERQAPRGPSLEDQLKNLRKTSKEKQSDLNNRLKRY